MIVASWLNASPDPHYGHNYAGGRRAADWSQLSVLDTIGDHRATVLTDCLDEHPSPNVTTVRVASLGGNPYHDRWRHLRAWLDECDEPFVWAVDANDVRLLNDPYPDWLDPDMLYVGSEPTGGANKRSVGFWWMRQLHPDHADWIDRHAHLPLLNAGLIGGTPVLLREFCRDLIEQLAGCSDVTEMAAEQVVLYERWAGRYVTGHPMHTPMWSFAAADPTAIWAHK